MVSVVFQLLPPISLISSSPSFTMAADASSLPGPNVAHFLKLTETNYLLWLRQMRPFLNGHDLWKYVDGSYAAPCQTLAAVGDAPPEPNPAYQKWYKQDQLVVSYLTTTLTEPILSITVGHDTSHAIWECLRAHFAQQSVANASNIRFQLLDLNKGSKTISEFLQHAKSLSDSLSAIDQPVSNADLVTAVLRGLGPDYTMLVTAILNSPPLPNFTELRARLLSFESQTARSLSATPASPTTAFLTTHNANVTAHLPSRGSFRGSSRGRGFRGNHRGSWNGRGRGSWNSQGSWPRGSQAWHGVPNNFSSRSSAGRATWPSPDPGLLGASPASVPWCHSCSTNQHAAVNCPHRYSGPDFFSTSFCWYADDL